MKNILRYTTFSLLIVVASYLAFQAGRRGLHSESPRQKLFRSFPIFNQPSIENLNTGLNTPFDRMRKKEVSPSDKKEDASQIPAIPENKKDEDKKSDIQSETDSIEKDSTQATDEINKDDSEVVKDNNTPAAKDSFTTVELPKEKVEIPTRKKIMPHVSDVFVPVFQASQFNDEAAYGFGYSFPSHDPGGKLFVLDRKISSQEGIGFQVHVYEKEGRRYVGTFETAPSWRFPFSGTPTFSKVHDNSFKKNTRFLVFEANDIDVNPFLTQEHEAQALIQTAYEDSIDSHLYLGKDNATQLDIYKVFPGIFTARTLR